MLIQAALPRSGKRKSIGQGRGTRAGEGAGKRRLGSRALTGAGGRSEFFELGASIAIFLAAWEQFDDFAQFADGGRLLAELEHRRGAVKACGSQFEAFRIVVDDFVVFGDGFLILLFLVTNFADVKLRVRSQICLAVVLQVIREFRARQVIFATLNVAQTVGIEHIGGRAGAGSSPSGRRTSSWRRNVAGGGRGSSSARSRSCPAGRNFGVEVLHGVLQIHELLIELAESRLDFLKIV